jgi:hypothetical protein
MARPTLLLLLALLLTFAPPARAVDIQISAAALQSTLVRQLFSSADGRYYLRGNATQPCSISVENPQITLANGRLLVHIHLLAHVGHPTGSSCFGITLSEDADVSMLPVPEGPCIRFTDVRVERLNGSNQFDFLLNPFVRHTVPQSLTLNAADLLAKLVSRSRETTGYAMAVSGVQVHAIQVQSNAVVLTLDGTLSVD